jgi:asparagine synthase (glutamine-hydrolysing)
MCGFLFCCSHKKSIDVERFIDGLTLIRHRGPDGSGLFLFNTETESSELIYDTGARQPDSTNRLYNAAIGHRRLAVIDTTKQASQPMISSNGRYIIAYNGEIYNFAELKDNYGLYDLKSTGDTEVLLECFARDGLNVVTKLRGMFSFIIFDRQENTVTMVRDQFGVKPLYIFENNSYFAVASEIKAFYGVEGFDFETSEEDLLEYQFFREVSNGRTLWKDVRELEPGHAAVFQLGSGALTTTRWWKLESRQADHAGPPPATELYERLEQSVSYQMVSDVPLGTQLSGGIDSSAVTLMASKLHSGNLSTFTVGFTESEFDESCIARRFSKTINSRNHTEVLSREMFVRDLQDVTWHMEQPINHPNTVGIFELARLAAAHVKVILSGEGADEVFAGYRRRYLIANWIGAANAISPLLGGVSQFAALANRRHYNFDRLAFLSSLTPDEALVLDLAFGFDATVQTRSGIKDLLASAGFNRRLETLRSCDADDRLTQAQLFDIRVYLPELLKRQDKMCMAFSVENRVPFLDHEFVSWAFTLPKKMRLRGTTGKWVLRQAMAARLPDFVLDQPKRGFSIPLERWMGDELDINADHLGNDKGRSKVGNWQDRWIKLSFDIWQKSFTAQKIKEHLDDTKCEDRKFAEC